MNETKKISNEEKNQKLYQIILDLSNYEDDYDGIVEELKNIYDGEYRHSYAQISRNMFYLDFDERETVSSGLDNVIFKLVELEQKEPSTYSSIRKSVVKLKDHIDLEIMRYNLNDEANDRLETAFESAEELNKTTSFLSDEVVELQGKSWDFQNKMESLNTQSITILSIFAGLVFVFTGGLSFISTALQILNDASVYKLTFVLSLIGMLMFDLIFLFFYMIAKLTDKNISSPCIKTHNQACDWVDECQNCNIIQRYLRRFHYVIIPNIFFISTMIGTVIIWLIRRG